MTDDDGEEGADLFTPHAPSVLTLCVKMIIISLIVERFIRHKTFTFDAIDADKDANSLHEMLFIAGTYLSDNCVLPVL
ncbi:hypothetical protein [Paracoccus onubensis]|uniref:Uncharacterized protein n=1 Tax=Paracoccus onubensis TaxID=1675788 RepID=A0A418SQ56_9RHOB|nr:hypothetical protein [Paracoccus onubensis]RJE83100.1 hypothetical protein D3P04_16705 [Paracoccus onubensis]